MEKDRILDVNAPMHESTLASLNRVAAIENRSRSDIIGRAIKLYEFLSLEQLKGHKILVEDTSGNTKIVVYFNKEK